MEFVSLGGNKFVCAGDVSAIIEYGLLMGKNYIQRLKDEGKLLDATGGKTPKSAVVLKSGIIILSEVKSETMKIRVTDCETGRCSYENE